STAASFARVGRNARALRLSPADGAAAEGTLARECQTNLPSISRGRVDCAHQATAEDGATTARPEWHRRPTQSVLEHGLCERQVGGRALVPHSDGGGPVHTGVRGVGSGSFDDGVQSGRGARTRTARTGPLAREHYGGQRQ